MSNKEQLIKLSVSKTNTFESCKAKYKFVYIHKLPRKEFTYHLFGRFVHRVLELFHLEFIQGTNLSFNQVMNKVYKTALQEKEFAGKLTKEAKDESVEILKKYLLKHSTEATGEHKPNVYAVEKNFDVEIMENVKLIGMIDRVQIDSDGIYHVVDYKTTKNKKYLEQDSLQLLTYAYVLLQENPEIKEVRGSYVLLRHDCERITKKFNLDQILEIKNKYETYARNIMNEQEFPANPTKLCGFCEYVDKCPEGLKYINGGFKNGPIPW